MRIREIDIFRGVTIVLMVFFSIICRLSRSLPDALIHNIPNSLHTGDLVLPMFLFASGMSIVFFAEKHGKRGKKEYVLDIIERFGMLAGIAILLSVFSGGGFFEMDELMLSAILFLVSILLVGFSEIMIFAVMLLVFLIYFVLQNFSLLPDFSLHYLGGYRAAIFYLPVMLGGIVAAKRLGDIEKLILFATVCTILLFVVSPPYKMSVEPGFMALSVLVSLVVFYLVRQIQSNYPGIAYLEYLGRKPLRYWVLMFLVLIVPMAFYGIYTEEGLPLQFGWIEALILSFASLGLLYGVSKMIDFVEARTHKKVNKGG
ncbi:MAG: heparan-alpha-glucosaminide N-acetyltransferase domain-containing protein [Candidatus Micrarchaeota archaeon]